MPDPHDDFTAYAQARLPRLVTTAHLLSGATGDPREATELVRRTLVGVCARWRRIPRDDVDFYVRRSLVKEFLRGARRQQAPSHGVLKDTSARQRAVLVMLHREGLREAEVAQLLGWSAGAVSSRARRGLAVCGGDAGRLRELFAEAAQVGPEDVPFGVPLDAVEKRGRSLRRRRRAVVAALCALLLVPAGVFAVDRVVGGGTAAGSVGGAVDMARSPIRIVTPGERVAAVPGVQMWLTSDGKHWSTPQRPNQFLGLTEDGYPSGSKAAAEKPVASVQPDRLNSSFFLSGLYRGLSADPARVEVTVDENRMTGTVLTLAGSPGWGVWYTRVPLSLAELKSSYGDGGPTVTVYDAAGKVVARGGADW
ncbi:DNA-directed RNA polymerase specialized sigma subunit, sigma24 family [Streptomyces sp. 3213]|uniref:sigma factor-like helix-turn-helix DNA-binding protein n=1 Tax=Streptomyces sp. 3213.3 TaxID=1855348 RepID=UPI00089C9DA4|nr:sigma factor-like helix-turn-helix DNA-binding protein [Streptomyces sp. 3213.3]SED93477.1 DNA-directed RNA polymerase specialized sigma subunit, sigma24 family [Streptomyces sp. 3213] [Streptomyces sp. 3213.3]